MSRQTKLFEYAVDIVWKSCIELTNSLENSLSVVLSSVVFYSIEVKHLCFIEIMPQEENV